VLTSLLQFARESGDLLLDVASGYVGSRRFAGLGPRPLALALRGLSAFTASLHFARLRRFTTMLNPRQILAFAPWPDVCLGHERTMRDLSNVRFTPQSGHVQCSSRCPLWANSGH